MVTATDPVVIPQRATRREWIGLCVLTLAALVYAMDLTVLNLAIPRISEELQPSSVQLLWIIDIYGFLVAGLLITMGTLGDRIGRRKLLLGGAAGFALASVFAAFSSSAEMLIVSRAVMGVAGATVAPSTLSLIFSMFHEPRQRSTAIGFWVASYSVGSAIGPVIGGVLLQFFWWGSVFLIGVPVMLVLLVLGPSMLPEYRDPEARRLDLLSAAMSLVAILAVVYGIKEMAQDGVSAIPAAAIVAGLILGMIFVRRQLHLESPIVDVRLFRIRAFSVSLVTYLLAVFVVIGYFLFISQYLQLVMGLSPLEAGLWSLPSSAGFVIGSVMAPRIINRFRPAPIVGVGMSVAAAGTCLLLVLGLGGIGNLLLVVAASIVIDLGLAPVITLATELIVGSAPPEQAGAATGVSETSGELGGALGIAILGSIGTAIYRTEVTDSLPAGISVTVADAARDTLGGAVAIASTLPERLAQPLLAAAHVAFLDALHFIAAVAGVSAVLTAIVAARALRTVPIRGGSPTAEAATAIPATD